MTHLSPEAVLDLVERDTSDHALPPHVQSCAECREQVLELRGLTRELASHEIPEPSPLFWEHFSERVRVAVTVEAPTRRFAWLDAWRS